MEERNWGVLGKDAIDDGFGKITQQGVKDSARMRLSN